MASHLFSRPSSAKFVLRNRLRRVLLESLERRELMAADFMGFSDLGAPVSYTLAGQASQPLAFQTTGDLSGMSPDEVTSYLDTAFSSSGGDLTSRAWFPLIQESYSKWSEQNGLAFSYSSGLSATDGLVAEGEAGGPRVLSIAPNSGDIFSFNNVNTLTEAPTELIFRFDGSSGIDANTIARGIKLIRANRDGVLGNGNDQIITPGYLNFGDNNKIVVMRFATTLPDDLYRVMVIGTDNVPANETAIKNAAGKTLDVRTVDSTPLDLTRDSVDFKVELGAQVVAVVPQPVDRLASNTVNLVQSGASFSLRVHQGDTTNNAAGTAVSLRLVQFGTTTTATYDKPTNRITVSLAPGATVNDVTTAIDTGLAGNFSIGTGSVVGGGNAVNALDLGIRTVSLTNWSLDPKQNQIRVYFNDDDLFGAAVKTGDFAPNPTVVDPAFYQLILTNDTVQPNDDVVFDAASISSISYDPLLNLATITYLQPLYQLAGGVGTFRLRIGGKDTVANVLDTKTIAPLTLAGDQSGDFTGASNVAGPFAPVTFNSSTSITVNESIITTSTAVLPLDYPGSNFEPGHRDIQDENHLLNGGDASPQISTQFYNFALNRPYGLDAAGRPVSTTITPDQLARTRDIFEFYSMVMGVDFVESESSGLTVVVGDMFPNGVQSGPGGVIGVAGGGLAIMDSAEVWDNSFGGQSGIPGSQNYFLVAMHEIGHLLGLGHATEQPVLTIMAGGALPFTEWSFPGDADIVHGQYLYRPDNRDVDSYKFVVPAGKSGTFTAETFAERLANSSNLDTYLTLLKETPSGFEVVAINNDSYSSDSFLSVKLTEGNYFISVTGKGNENFNPLIANTGDGAISQGNYQLKMDFQEDAAAASIVDPAGSALDGDGDGLAGGNFNFWFRTAAPVGVAAPGAPKTIYVDKGFAGAPTGSPAAPMNSLDLNNTVKWPAGFVQPGDIIRVVGSLGSDRQLVTSADNPAYEIGRGGVGNAILSDGINLEVPQGVTMMIDAGAIFKLGNTRITAGSLDAGIDKSFSSLQVLGTPRQTANFTSYNDQSQGTDTNPLVTSPQAGDWGGLDLHNNIDRQEGRGDYERKGIFLNYIASADIRYGGGQITVASPSPTINPINLNEARPTLLYNNIRFSADAAISADPNSFEETRFTEDRYQLAQIFRPDYDRVGPDLRGNLVTNNTVNGLFVRTSTFAGGPLTVLETAARWDDTDITYVLGENLIIAGTSGGSYLETTAPDVSLVQTNNSVATGGTLASQTVLYKVNFVDRFGGQSIPSAATPAKTVSIGFNAVQLANLPVAAGDFVGRRLWRSTDAGVTYRLVAELDRGTTSYTDIGADLAAVLANPNATSSQRARPDSRLQIDPGVVVKSSGSRIEVGMSAQLIAEGSADRKVIFTSRSDDRYGAGGTFDTNSNLSATNPGAGDWGGLLARHLSSISIDQALITFGGGVTSVSGGFAGFNAVEIHEADGRIANSILENNASGLGGNSGANRDGRGPHDASVIFVTGSQPVIVENIIRNNSVSNTSAISVNANALNTDNVQDRGRQTGTANRAAAGLGNSGPLVDGNLLSTNGLNGMRVRGQILTTATVWDDTDIVHILQSEVVVPDLHTYGGMRLQSKSDESLVVKLGTGAGLTATGTPLDIVDRSGGSLQILGAPGFPVVLTSLSDDSVGAGFDPNGRPLVDTNNNGASVGSAGNWRSIKLEPYASDRNLDTTFEYEPDQIQDKGTNDTASAAQSLGALAAKTNGGDENLRLGFTLHGTIAAPQDLDVYSFTGTAGTPVWIDIDQTNGSLDTVVELVDSSGVIIAQSNNSLQESANPSLIFITSNPAKITPEKVQPLDQDPFAPKNSFQPTLATDLYSVNPLDAGLRVILPGTAGGSNTYYVRVRSSNLKPGDAASKLQDVTKERDGLTTGAYRLQVRLQQNDETAGSTIRFADIRFATNGIEANGMPAHSPLLGQIGEQGNGGSDAVDSLTNLVNGPNVITPPGFGNIANSDRGSVSLAGTIGGGGTAGAGDIDLYSFSINRDATQGGPNTHISTVLDIDYADGLGRPDTSLWVYRIVNNSPVLVLIGTDSNIADDRSAPEQGSDLDALSRGSVGARDPFIGASELPAGNYIVAVSNNSRMAASMQQYQTATPSNALIRLEPVNSVNRLFVDRIGGTSPDTTTAAPVIFTTDTSGGGISAGNTIPWTLADLTAYVTRNNGNGSQLAFGNAQTGVQEAEISNFVRVNDAVMSPDGRLVGYEIPVGVQITDANSGNFHLINSIGAAGGAGTPANASNFIGNSGIQTFTTQQNNTAVPATFAVQQRDQNGPFIGGNTPQGDGIQFNDLTFFTQTDSSTNLFLFGVGSRANGQTSYNMAIDDGSGGVAAIGPLVTGATNFVYKLDPNSGAAINPNGVGDRTGLNIVNAGGAGTQKVEFGQFISTGTVTGLAEIGGSLFGVSNLGQLFRVNAGDGTNAFGTVNSFTTVTDLTGSPIAFTSLTAGPRNLEGGRFAQMLFGTTADGTIWAFDSGLDASGNIKFPATGGVKQPIFPGFSPSIKSTSSPLNSSGSVSGIDFSPLDVNLWHQTNTRNTDAGHGRTIPFDSSQAADLQGGNSLYFGFEDGNRGATNRQQGSWQGVYNVPAYNGNYNLPGGARGAIVSNTMDLRGYSADDLPMLYFNYFLATENSNSTLDDGDVRMNDAFRVYGAGEDGNWILLTTNNSALSGANRNTAADEFDTAINQDVDPYGNPLYTQETFDNTGSWRQARTSLSTFAGQQNVRLRFEFSSGASFRTGDPLLGGVELSAVVGAKLTDGEVFLVTPQDGVSAVGARIFELDMGLILDLPGGASITSGVSQMIIGGTTVTFTTSAPGVNEIQYSPADTPAQIATKVRAALPAILGIAAGNITVNSLRPNVLNISGLVASNAPRIGEVEANNSLATPQNIDGSVWTLGPNAKVDSSTTRPHLSILGTGNASFDYYSFTANAGDVGVFDMDATNFDTELFLYDSAGNLLAENDDANLDPGSTSSFDSFISHTFATAGTYIIGVGRFNSLGLPGGIIGSTPLAGDIYQLNISLDGKATLAPNYDVVGLPKSVIAGVPGVTVGGTTGIVSVAINQSMTETQVRDAIRAQLASTYNNPLAAPTANASAVQAWPVHNSTLRLFKYSVAHNSGLGLTTNRSGDQFGVQGSTGNRMDERAQNNAFEGVYIDDIIVGFAERGEMVFNSTATDTVTNFVANTHYSGLASTFAIPQVEQGAYQLTVRTAAEYGIQDTTRITLPLGRSFDTNARLAQQVGIRVTTNLAGAPNGAAGQFADGITFTISDGFNQATFEFDVTVGAGDRASGVTPGNIAVRITANATPTQIATAIRDAINSSTAQLILSLNASLQGEMTYGSVFGDVANSGSAFVLLHGAAATSRTGGLTFSSTPLLTAVSSGTESAKFGEDLGDTERQREQGQILLVGNSITNSSQFGINNDAGARNQQAAGSRPYPGSPIQLPTPNQFGLAPGVVIMNNILANNASGGLRLSGDGANTGMAVPSLITRVINNTVFGGADGILVDEGASPTILNNIIANTTNGIRSVGSTVVLGANIFQNNGTNTVGTGGNGSFAELLNPGDPLFVSTTNRRFYLAAGSKAIDSSLEALQERPELTQVKNAISLPLSPMLAPDVDVTGQRRVDDPSVNSPAGLGGNVFKDRGAVDRSDFLGLNAIILQPQDNDSKFKDVDRNTTFIQLTEGELEFFSLLLQDTNGTGPDDATVNAAGAVILTENGKLLIPDVDYVFGYNANSRTIHLTPIAGIWRKDSVYEISLNNRDGIQLKVGAAVADGNRYTINYPGGPKVFEFDTGSPAGVSAGAVAVKIQSSYTPYQAAAQLVAAINGAGIGITSYLQGDGTLMVLGATSITATGAALGTPLSVGAIRDLAGNALFPNRATSLTQFTIVMPEVKLDFGDATGVNIPTIKAPNSGVAPVVTNGDGARHALLPIDVPLLALGRFVDADTDGVPSASASSDDTETLVALETLGTLGGASFSFSGSATLTVNRAAIVDGQTFTITDTTAHPLFGVVFEFTTDASVIPGNVPVFVAGGDTSAIVANNLAAIVNGAVQAGRLDDLIAVVDSSSPPNIRLVANAGYQLNIPVATAPALARLANGNSTIVLANTVSAAMDGNQFSIRDGNGNLVRFELNHVPAATIPVPVPVGIVGIDLDLSTATPTTLASAIATAINQQIALRNLVMPPATATAGSVSIVVDDEEGVLFKGMFNASSNPVIATVTSTGAGMLDAWIDWNGDGDFNDSGEQIIVSQPVQAGDNTYNLTTPINAAVGFVNARFRLSTLGGTLPGGLAVGGEVEDYLIEIVAGTPPTAVSDAYTVNEDTTLNATDPRGLLTPGTANDNGVLANDSDADNDLLAIPPYVEPRFVYDENPNTVAIDPLVNVSNGILTLNLDGTFSYVPNLDFNGTDRFVYNVIDQRLRSNVPTTVTITVVAQNDAPLAVNDTISNAVEDIAVVRAGSVFTVNDYAHFGMAPGASFSANASNESGQVLTLVGAAIISDMTTSFGGIAGLGVRIAAKPGQGTYGIRVNVLTSDLGVGTLPTVSVVNSTITVTLNSNAASISTVNNFIAAINGNAAASTLVSAVVTSGAGTTQIGNVAPAYSPLVVPPSGGTFSVASNQLTYTPPAHYNSNIGGPALLLLTIQDDASAGPIANLTSTSTLTINIAAVNDRPQYDPWSDPKEVATIEVRNDNVGALVTVPNFITGIMPGPVEAVDEATGPSLVAAENQLVTFSPAPPLVRALNPALFAVQPTIAVVGTTGTLTFQLAQDVNRVTPFPKILVEVIAQDSGALGGANNDLNQSIARTFTIVPTEVNDAPEFTIPVSTGSLEDKGVVTVDSFMTGIRKGPVTALDEVAQTLSITIVADPTAFTATGYPTIDLATGQLRYETAPHVNRYTGQNFNVSVTVSDDGGTANGGVDRTTKSFLIDVTELNDAPEYAMPSVTSAFVEDPNALPNAPTVVPGFVTSIMPGPVAAVDEGPLRENQVVSFVVTALDPTLFDPAFLPAISNAGTLTYRLRPDVNQITPFPRILVRVVAVDTGLNDAGNAVPRNINNAAPRTFTILPDPINDAPEFNLTATANSREDAGVVTLADFVTGAAPGPVTALDELASQTLTITVVALDPTAFTATGQPKIVLAANGKGVLTYQTNRDVNSLTGHDLRVRVTLKDNGGTANVGDVDTTIKTFSLVVAAINDAPSFSLPAVPSVTVDEDNESVTGVTPTVLPMATNVVAGPATALDETTIPATRQTLVFDTTSVTNAGLFVSQPMLLPNGNLTFTTRKDRNGQSVVVVRLRDSGADATTGNGDINVSAEQTFTINIRAINDAPEFAIQPTATSREDQGLVSIPNFATGLSAGPATAVDELSSQIFTVHVRALDPAAFSVQPAIAADGTLTFQTALDVNSTMVDRDLRVEVYVDDDGVAGPPPNDNISDPKTFTIITTAVNDAPVFTLPVTQVDVIEDVEQFTGVSPTTVTGFATGVAQAVGLLSPIRTATDELSQTLSFEVLSVTAPELFSVQPTISNTGVLSFRTAQNKNGKAVVIVRLLDNGASSPVPNDNDSDRKTFTISIAPINDAPQFDIPSSLTVAEDAGLFSQNSFATNVRRGPVGSEDENSQEIKFEVVALSPSSFTVQPTIGVDGTLIFQTAPNVNIANADMRVRVQLTDNGASSPAPNTNLSLIKTFTVNATPVNDPPIPNAFGVVINEDESVTILAADVLVGDRPGPTADENNQLMSITQVERTSVNGGTIIPVFNGSEIVSFQYTPPQNLVGTDTFLYVVTDTGVPARSGTGTITISLLGVNDPPQFVKGSDQIVPEDSQLTTISGWATSILPGPPGAVDELNSQTVSFTSTADKPALFDVQPAIASDGTLTFKPKPNANGVAIVTVIAVDNGAIAAQSQPQIFTISINPVNDPPVFTAGPSVSVVEDSGPFSRPWATSIAPAAGLLLLPPTATDESSQVVDFTLVADKPNLFSVQPSISSSGQLQFTPNRDAFGTALVIVRAVDRGPSGGLDQNTSAPQTLTITITPANDAPVAVADTLNTNENTLLTLAAPGLLANDTDVDLPNDVLTAVPGIFQSALGAKVTINANGSITYDSSLVDSIQQLTTGQSVQDTFVYKIKDSAGVESIAATVSVNVAGVNDAPTARDDAYNINVGQSQFLDVLANDSDIDSPINPATISVTSLPAFGTVLINQTGVIQYTPGGGFRGIDSFRYTVRDTAGNVSNEALVTVTVNNRPVANPDTAITFKNQSIDINVLANDSDLDGSLNPASVQIVLTPSPSGTATVLANGSIRFVPATNFSGTVTLSYVVSDDIGTVSNVANVDIRVQRSRWQNPRLALDVNADTFISPIDALLIINKLNDPTFERDLTKSNFVPPPFLDVNGDELVSPLDALLVINYLNSNRGAAEGEGEANLSATTYAMMVTPQQMIAAVGNQVVQELQLTLNESLLNASTDSHNSTSASLAGWFDDDQDEELVEGLFCSSDEKMEKVVDAVDSYFETIGPHFA